MSEITTTQWATILGRAGERVTIRIPRDFREQMEVRARTAGRSINEEYGRAVESWCAGGEGWVKLALRAEVIHEWVTPEVVRGQQLSTVLVDRLEMDGKYVGLRLAGYAITLDREWFANDQGFEETRLPLANALPLLAQSGGGWGPGPHSSTIFTYGRMGHPCRKVGCMASGSELVTLIHTDSNEKPLTLDIPLCRVHALETRAAIAQGEAPRFCLT